MFLLALPQAPDALPFVSNVFSSHMVLQRDKPNTFWGWTKPGEKVTVSVGGKSGVGTADSTGKWKTQVMPPKVGGPYRVKIDGSQHVVLDDVLVGDVWICAGQSNMEMGLTAVAGGPEAVANATNSKIRLFMAPHQIALKPMPVNAGTWEVCSPQSVAKDGWGGISAVGYFFCSKLQKETGVPIGLLHDNWGGTNAESWMSKEMAHRLGDFDRQLAQAEAFANSRGNYAEQVNKWYAENEPGVNPQSSWFQASGWKPVKADDVYGGIGWGDVDGIAWARCTFNLTADQAAKGGVLTMGAIDDADATWVNGTLVGATNSYNAPRSYNVKAGTLKAGANTLAVRILDTGGPGGFTNPELLQLKLEDGTTIPLQSGWEAKGASDLKKTKPFPVDSTNNPNIPTVLSNGMIEPIVPLAIKGAIWYQGENNSGRAYQYRRVLPSMIQDWRNRFQQGDFPFYIVSLAAYQPHKTVPSDDDWAELREAQAMTAAKMKNSGLAMTIDVGDAADIHPRDKKTVGERLALIALARDYGKSVVYQGPTYKSMAVSGSSIVLKFDHAKGLTAKGGAPGEFSICGSDHKWVWADAKIVGETIVVSSPSVSQPVAVRYAWQSNPTANLYNAAGLPMVPFRTDQFPGITVGRK